MRQSGGLGQDAGSSTTAYRLLSAYPVLVWTATWLRFWQSTVDHLPKCTQANGNCMAWPGSSPARDDVTGPMGRTIDSASALASYSQQPSPRCGPTSVSEAAWMLLMTIRYTHCEVRVEQKGRMAVYKGWNQRREKIIQHSQVSSWQLFYLSCSRALRCLQQSMGKTLLAASEVTMPSLGFSH